MKAIKIAIIIPTYNRKELLGNLLNQLIKISDKLFTIELVVVEDGCEDGTKELIDKDFKSVHLIHGTGSWWYTKSINEGIQFALDLQPDYILLLNDDVILGLNYLENIVAAGEKYKRNAIISSVCFSHEKPYLIFDAGVKKILWWRFKFIKHYRQFTIAEPKNFNGVVPTLAITGRGTLVPVEILKHINAYDEKFIQYGSDLDFGLRAQQMGVKCYCCYDAQIFSIIQSTGKGASFIKQNIFQFIASLFNKYSINYLPDSFRLAWRYGYKFIFPITAAIIVMGNIKAFFFNKKIA